MVSDYEFFYPGLSIFYCIGSVLEIIVILKNEAFPDAIAWMIKV